MLDNQQLKRISQIIAVLQNAPPELVREFQQVAFLARIPVGHDVFLEGDNVDAIALLISGAVRVYKIGETGREITLYRFGYGQSCILTANAILSHKTFPAIATVEQDAEAVMIPAETFREWVGKYEAWREFVFELLSDRLSTVMAIVDEVVFQRMDRRVATFLINKARLMNPIRITHQELAAELGSSREVVSRILEDFSQKGVVEVGRGTVTILDLEGLTERATV